MGEDEKTARLQTWEAQLNHCAGRSRLAADIQRDVLRAQDPREAVAGHGTVNLAVYELTQGNIQAASRILDELDARRAYTDMTDVWEIVWYRAAQLHAIVLSTKGLQMQALERQRRVVEGLAHIVDSSHEAALQSQLVLGGLYALLGEYDDARSVATNVIKDMSNGLDFGRLAYVQANTLLALANYGLDRFKEAAWDLVELLGRLTSKERSTPTSVYAYFVAFCAACNTSDPPTTSNPPSIREILRPSFDGVRIKFGSSSEVTTVAQLSLAEVLVGFGPDANYHSLLDPLVKPFLDVNKPLCGIEYQWQSWAASLTMGSLIDEGRLHEADLLARSVVEIATTNCGEGSISALRAQMESIGPLLLRSRLGEAVDVAQGALRRSMTDRGEYHAMTQELAGATVRSLAAVAVLDTSRRDECLRMAQSIIVQFDSIISARNGSEESGGIDRAFIIWQCAKVALLAYSGYLSEAIDMWEPMKRVAVESFGAASNYARTYKLFDDELWRLRADLD